MQNVSFIYVYSLHSFLLMKDFDTFVACKQQRPHVFIGMSLSWKLQEREEALTTSPMSTAASTAYVTPYKMKTRVMLMECTNSLLQPDIFYKDLDERIIYVFLFSPLYREIKH